MKYPYSNPNLRFIDLINAFRLSKSEADTYMKGYFQKLTRKKYILITNSCRTALYLSYRAIEKTGEVITSPLTCKVAIDPINESENSPVFADIKAKNLNIDPSDIAHRITSKTIAIQAIHLGGLVCDMDHINRVAKENKLLVVEDCAQSLGAYYNGKPAGSFGDIACFSLIKNAYGIGGGILATNDKNIYERAKSAQSKLNPTPWKLAWFRIVRNLIDTKRQSWVGKSLFCIMFWLRGEKRSYHNVKKQLYEPSRMELKIAAHQIKRFSELHKKRRAVGNMIINRLQTTKIKTNKEYLLQKSSFSKVFICLPNQEAQNALPKMHQNGVEAMHLEHKHGGKVQEPIIARNKAHAANLNNYLAVHDYVVSLPVRENFRGKDIDQIIQTLQKVCG